MPKRLRRDPIYIAPEIIGRINDDGTPQVFDERTLAELNPSDPFDKIKIYERQVTDWFLKPAQNLVRYKSRNKGFIVLMICLSYIEGAQEYRTGLSSRNRSNEFFRNGFHRLYPNRFANNELDRFYIEARCGLFHNGMVRGQILINNIFDDSLSFPDQETIKVSPSKLLNDITADFEEFIEILKNDETARGRFDSLYSNI
ncbi:hypothetical protein [Cognataquiflexum rubidum]|uniref:hypothetical protein n=1 Tax=Cognataquiflexum rubidum TaxID=2922273 RepID=UPI001F135BD2|nr:hypothetical protein [Cognataquiflexum rubidum]MCH6236661.1 hypothetical protein [Cognataquiflexum rubidum]